MFIISNFSDRRFIIQGPIFAFLLIFYNYFIIESLCNILEYPISKDILLAIIGFLAIIHVVPMYLERKKTRVITSYLLEISNLWLWASFMYLFEIIFFKLVSFFINLPIPVRLFIILLVVIFGIIGYYIAHKNYVKEYDLKFTSKDSKDYKDLSIIHISDIHIGSIRRQKTLKTLVENINSIINSHSNRKYIIVVSGDIADGSCPILEDTFNEFKKVDARIFFTPGNHDYYQSIDLLKQSLINAGMTVLDNDNMILEEYGLNVIGLRYTFEEDNEKYELPVSSSLNNVLIYHAPMYWKEFSEKGIDLELSGHTHGGQFYPANLWVKVVFPYLKGLYKNKVFVENISKEINTYLSVTDGIGTMGPPIRLGTKSEITVLNITRK